ELGQVVVIERVCLTHVAARIELVIPNLSRRRALLEEEHHGLDARTLKRPAGAVEHGMKVAAFEQEFAQTHGGVVGVRQEGVFNDHAAAPSGLEHLDEVLKK